MGKAAAIEFRQEAKKSLPKRLIGPFCCVFALFYLAFHAMSGERGLLALFTETRRLDGLQRELADISGKRQALERKVNHLSSNSLDLDLLDEQARIVLGMAGKNEVVYFDDKTAPVQK